MAKISKYNSEGYKDPTPYEALKNVKNPKRQMQGAQARAVGQHFENMIDAACRYYEDKKLAVIEKTPEPMKPLKSMGAGKFLAVFTGQAQTDYKGIINGGRCIAFEAKHTDDERIEYKRLTDKQVEMLERYNKMGASCFILVSFGLQSFYRIPWPVWRDMKQTHGRKYLRQDELTEHQIPYKDGMIQFLQHKKPSHPETCVSCGDIIPEGRQVCPSCEKGDK